MFYVLQHSLVVRDSLKGVDKKHNETYTRSKVKVIYKVVYINAKKMKIK